MNSQMTAFAFGEVRFARRADWRLPCGRFGGDEQPFLVQQRRQRQRTATEPGPFEKRSTARMQIERWRRIRHGVSDERVSGFVGQWDSTASSRRKETRSGTAASTDRSRGRRSLRHWVAAVRGACWFDEPPSFASSVPFRAASRDNAMRCAVFQRSASSTSRVGRANARGELLRPAVADERRIHHRQGLRGDGAHVARRPIPCIASGASNSCSIGIKLAAFHREVDAATRHSASIERSLAEHRRIERCR